ncbi:MAG: hypothetical protein FJZ63_04100 [Chlamydiae bacterium]|nr:hypothetical protein [Chlamydiota bacterium]
MAKYKTIAYIPSVVYRFLHIKEFFMRYMLSFCILAILPLIATVPRRGFVLNQGGSPCVSILDLSTNSVITNLPVGSNPQALAVTPDGAFLYVTNQNDDTVTVIDVASNSVKTTITSLDTQPNALAITPDGRYVYVCCNVNGSDAGFCDIIDTSSNQIITRTPIDGGPYGIVFTPDGTKAYIACVNGISINVINTSSPSTKSVISLSGPPLVQDIAITPDGTKLFVPLLGVSTMVVISTSTNTIIKTFSDMLSSSPTALAITPNGLQAFLVSSFPPYLVAVNTSSYAVDSSITGITMKAWALGITPNGKYVYVFTNPNEGSAPNQIYVVDAKSHQFITSFTLEMGEGYSTGLQTIAMTGNKNQAYVVNFASNSVSLIDEKRVLKTIQAGSQPYAVVVTPKMITPSPLSPVERMIIQTLKEAAHDYSNRPLQKAASESGY